MLLRRRSTTAVMLQEPGPDENALAHIIAAGTRVPDHRRVVPYRFVTFTGAARDAFGEVLGTAFMANNPEAEAEAVALEKNRFLRAPTVVAVIASLKPEHKTPVWEQTLTVGAVCHNMLLAASALGFAGQWLTEWYAYDATVAGALELGSDEQVAGFMYFGTAKEDPKERPRVEPATLVTAWSREDGQGS
jgi:nitroreductase